MDISSSTDVRTVSENLTKRLKENFQDEVEKALYGQGKYRLAASCQQFFVDPTIWLRWSISRRQQHLESFLSFIPRSYQKYEKPSDAGLKKKPGRKRRVNLPEADFFVDKVRGDIDHSSSASDSAALVVTPLKVKKQKNGKTKSYHWEIVNKNKVPTVDIFNTNRVTSKIYRLVHKSD